MIAKTPSPPYYAVIFTLAGTDCYDGYGTMNDKLIELIQKHPGYLGHESAREGIGITAAYFDSLESIKNWKTEADHKLAQQYGREKWYTAYKVRICKVERDYGFELQT